MLNLQRSNSSSTTGEKYSFEEMPLDSLSPGQNRRKVTYTYEDQQLYEDGKPMKATIQCSEMTSEMEKWAIDCAAIAIINRASIKHVAAYIKKEFDKAFGPSWQCIVGNSFGRDHQINVNVDDVADVDIPDEYEDSGIRVYSKSDSGLHTLYPSQMF